jgi:hypothetical protein
MAIEDYYHKKYADFKDGISFLNEDQILQINSQEAAQANYEQIKLPLILKDETRPLRKELVSKIFVYDSEDEIRLNKISVLSVSYPIKPFEKLNEVLSRSAESFECRNADWNIQNKPDCIEILQPPASILGSYNNESEVDTEKSEQKMDEVVQFIETLVTKKNSKVVLYNSNFQAWIIDYLEKLKKAILTDRKEKANNKTKGCNIGRKDVDSDWEDSDENEQGRTSNDDRSDSLNPNNSAYDAAQDNHSNQLNPNNSRYQGE